MIHLKRFGAGLIVFLMLVVATFVIGEILKYHPLLIFVPLVSALVYVLGAFFLEVRGQLKD